MTLSASEILICNQALDRISAANIVIGGTPAKEYNACNRSYSQVRDSLLRSFEWNFANGRTELSLIYNLILDSSPDTAFAVDDVITGITSGATATILTVISDVEYEIAYLEGTFSDGETITNDTVYPVTWQGIPLTSGSEDVVTYDHTDLVVCGTGYPIVTAVVPEFGYDYQYLLPSDFSRLRVRQNQHNHAIEGKYLLSRSNPEKIEYVKKVTDTALFDDLFTECLILKLALVLSSPIAGIGTATLNLKAEIKDELRYALSKARQVGKMEDTTPTHHPWLESRYRDSKMIFRG